MRVVFEFHVSRRARERYQFDEMVFASDGRRLMADFEAARRFVERIYLVTGRQVPASDIYAAGLIDEILHLLIRQYETQHAGTLARALNHLHAKLDERLEATLLRFNAEFPTNPVYKGTQSPTEYLAGSSKGVSHRQITMEEMLLLHITGQNPALEPYKELFDDSALEETAYRDTMGMLIDFFARQPALQAASSEVGETLVEVLAAPARAAPYSLEGQLQFLLERWGEVLGQEIINLLLRAMDFVREEVIRRTGPPGGPRSEAVPDYRGDLEYERYSLDRDWMPRLVLMAKNSYVWLEQLSRKYGRWIQTLDQVPDEELDLLAQRGLSGLWLIGLWERSRASQRIKQRMGQADAVASAYSLDSYDIAGDLGGWRALQDLRARAAQRGLRLSADMVPNHMGIDSHWVMEHPDWFLSLDRPPYPSYSFSSENLADDARVGIYLEDHYYDHSDAAVVFQRRDHSTGDSRYIYHGNDGTSFPWNDTAQLDYSRADVCEAVIQTILHVARNFPIIRFDAAMTLAKKHIQRLWFPQPGAGGAIPSRSEHGMTQPEFEAAMPHEFWREVVDRVAAEVPDTLLLAEAFWLMEGYFVRTLGMHRVYNSAFMHMLRDEENAKYRQLIKNTLEFDPQILKRYVNFMSNPDEKTAVEQFGNGDKYFGVCTLLATLPGVPMFAHGQIEGFHEKYGMEFRKPNWDETPDEALAGGHEWKIFPLLHRRHLFADVENYCLFDFYMANGKVNENVFSYSNRRGDERALVMYHGKYAETRGWARLSAAALDKGAGRLVQKTIAEALDLPRQGHAIFKDYVTHLEYIRSCADVWHNGLYAELGAYQHHVFMDWRFVSGDDWSAVCAALKGRGVGSTQEMWDELFAPKVTSTKDASGEEALSGKARNRHATNRKKVAVKRRTNGRRKKASESRKTAGDTRRLARRRIRTRSR